jgi:hypothetical protein
MSIIRKIVNGKIIEIDISKKQAKKNNSNLRNYTINDCGIAISTFFRKNNKERIHKVFKRSIETLLRTPFYGPIVLVDDCSEINDHLDWLKEYDVANRIHIHKRSVNGGISRCKNTCIRLLLEKGCKYLFLNDDDIEYLSTNWHTEYISATNETGIDHFCFNVYGSRSDKIINNFKVHQTNNLNGCLITVTKEMIDKIGYFQVLPNKYGHEHTSYTLRAIHNNFCNGFLDLVNSKSLIKLIEESEGLTSVEDCRNAEKLNQNAAAGFNIDYKKYFIIEE